MGKIICLMGKSSTGKDTIYKELLKRKNIAFRTVVPYTTRPIRAGEQEGVEYHFTDEEGFQSLKAQGK
ncbi:MAG: guanylate kinase, partial [Lachnospiraceae bacterium]|nr:guanylate kinase [Lachnospiraceae bacterium]